MNKLGYELNMINRPEEFWETLKNKKIILYGASGTAKAVLNNLDNYGISPVCFCDGNQDKWGTEFFGYDIISVNKLCEMEKGNTLIIISSVYVKEIKEQLINWGIDPNIIVSYFTVHIGLMYAAMRNMIGVPLHICQNIQLQKYCYDTSGDMSYEFDNSMNCYRFLQLLKTNKEIVFVFQPGQVGSTSIYKSISEKYYVIHLHDLYMFFKNNGITEYEWKKYLEMMSACGRKIKIISAVRNPIKKIIASYFKRLSATNGLSNDFDLNIVDNVQQLLKPKRFDGIDIRNSREYYMSNFEYGQIFDWFNLELKTYFNIDIYKSTFCKERGYDVYQNGNIDVFLYRFENIKDIEEPIANFLQDQNFKLSIANSSKEKGYYWMYQDALSNIDIPSDVLDFYYDKNKCVDFFYTSKEKKQMRDEWKR